eukprot:scaffold212635_cov37-Tisochrysis_lutea.AAC.2
MSTGAERVKEASRKGEGSDNGEAGGGRVSLSSLANTSEKQNSSRSGLEHPRVADGAARGCEPSSVIERGATPESAMAAVQMCGHRYSSRFTGQDE